MAALYAPIAALAVCGVVGGARWRRIELRRAEINQEYEKTMVELRAFDEDRLRYATELKAKEEKTALMHETVESLWADRLQRYEKTNRDLDAYLVALPEALGAVKGLTNHYHHMAHEMRKFVAFDVACSKVHNLSLLLERAATAGLPTVAETVQQLFPAEPLIDVVCESVLDMAHVSCPASIEESSAAFAFCMDELDEAVAAVGRRYTAEVEVAREPGVVSGVVSRVLSKLKVSTMSRGQREIARKRQALDSLLVREQRQLFTEEDLRAALEHVGAVQQQLAAPAAKGDTAAYLREVSEDPAVQEALRQLGLWRAAAAAFFMQRQAQEALDCYQLLLAETLTKVNA